MERRGSEILKTIVGEQKRLVMGAKLSDVEESIFWGGEKEFRGGGIAFIFLAGCLFFGGSSIFMGVVNKFFVMGRGSTFI